MRGARNLLHLLLRVVPRCEQRRAVEAHARQTVHHLLHETAVVHVGRELNVAEMARAAAVFLARRQLNLFAFARKALNGAVARPHPGVAHAALLRDAVHVRLILGAARRDGHIARVVGLLHG